MHTLFKQALASFLILFTLFSLSACGSGGSGNGGTNTNNNVDLTVKTGVFNDSIVTGLGYKTKTQSGVTNAMGQFNYIEGENVTFSVGDTVVGTAKAQPILTPLNLVPNAKTYTIYKDILTMTRAPDSQAYKDFSHLTNILVFLQSLDKDADPSNGITISPDVTALFKNKTIALNFDITDTPQYKKLTDITVLAASKNYLTTGRLKSFGQALNNFYTSQKIKTQFSLIKESLDDTKGDGTIVNRLTNDYDANGLKVQASHDAGNNNADISTEKFTYDNYDNRLTKVVDSDGDGNLDSTQTTHYDENGNITQRETIKANGKLASSYHLSYDENGNQIKIEYDSDGDGNPNSMILKSYNADAMLIEKKTDTNGDGSPESITTYNYDTNNYLITEKFDTDADSNADKIHTYKYDARGNKIFLGVDDNANGIDNNITTSKFDDKNNLIHQAYDADADGSDEQINTYTYDTNNFLVKVSYDTNADGAANNITTYDVDKNGNILKESNDTNADGNANSVHTYRYDTNNNQILSENDTNADGSVETRETSEYDSNSNRTKYTYDGDADGNPERIIKETYRNVSWIGVFGSLI